MNTGRLLRMQLRYALKAAETEMQRRQVNWWIENVERLAQAQPPAVFVEELQAAEPASAYPAQNGGQE